MRQTKDYKGTIVAYIRSLYPSLTKAEKKVADIVLEEKKDIIYDSLTDLAEKSHVGDTSVLRFCRHIGYKGFQDFKLALAQELEKTSLDDIEQQDNTKVRITKENLRIIEDSSALLDDVVIETIVGKILSARKTVFFGVGTSGLTAKFAAFRFVRTGLPIEAITESHLGMVKATLLTEQDVAIIISVSGSTVDIVDLAKRAKESMATVICITSHIKSPVTKYADITLLSSARETPTEGSAFSSIISQLFVLDIIFNDLLNELGDKGLEMIRLTAKATSKKLY